MIVILATSDVGKQSEYPSNVVATVGSKVAFHCRCHTPPRWERLESVTLIMKEHISGKQNQTHFHRLGAAVSYNSTSQGSTVSIKKVEWIDAGFYTCKCDRQRYTANLIVLGMTQVFASIAIVIF